MAMYLCISLLLVTAITATQTPPPPVDIQQNHLKNIIDALVHAGDFGGWAHLLSTANSSALPMMATLFIPSDSAAVNDAFDPFLISYHVLPRRLTFADLTHLAVDTRIPTLLPHKFVIITNNSASNFTVDGSQITQADIFSNTAFAVHGINNVLDYSVYGDAALNSPPPENIDVPEITDSSVGSRKEFFMGVKWVYICLLIVLAIFCIMNIKKIQNDLLRRKQD